MILIPNKYIFTFNKYLVSIIKKKYSLKVNKFFPT